MEKDSFQADSAGKTHTRWWAALLIVIAAARIAATYTVFSETIDEPVHFGAALEIFERHRYTVQLLNPPLPRVAFGVLPYLDGTTFQRIDPVYGHLQDVFQSPRGYLRTLALARAGNLIFFILAAIAVWTWARKEIGDAAGIATLLLFTTEPILLGYSGLVTHDIAAVAAVAVAMLPIRAWIVTPSWRNAALVGAAWGFGVACKFSCIPFIPAIAAAILIVRWREVRWKPISATIALVPLVAALVVWVSYGFNGGAFIEGIRQMVAINIGETDSYFFGQVSKNGWLWYFPAALLLKTTIVFLMFVVAALFAPQRRLVAECFAATAAILAVSMTSPLDLGVRYVLPVFVPLSVAAGAGLVAMFRRDRAAVALLVAWQLVASIVAHPDYFPYFNELAGRDPSMFLVDSNLDWGQDMIRLSAALRARKVQHAGIALFTNSDLDALGLPPRHVLNGYVPEDGWAAISEQAFRMNGNLGAWFWLRDRPYDRIGKSIRLYRLSGVAR